MTPDLPPNFHSPFDHLVPELWKRSKVSHITLFSAGTLLMIPGMYGLFAFVMLVSMWDMLSSSIGPKEMLGLISALASICTGCLAWCALGILFFKRADVRWQRWCWSLCAIYGFIATPSSIGWWYSAGQEMPSPAAEPAVLWAHLIFLFIFLVSVACAAWGVSHAKRAIAAAREQQAKQPSPMEFYGDGS